MVKDVLVHPWNRVVVGVCRTIAISSVGWILPRAYRPQRGRGHDMIVYLAKFKSDSGL